MNAKVVSLFFFFLNVRSAVRENNKKYLIFSPRLKTKSKKLYEQNVFLLRNYIATVNKFQQKVLTNKNVR